MLVQLAGDPAFVDALAETLRTRPAWRSGLLAALRHPKTGNPANADAVLGALQRRGGLDAEESAGWIETLLRDGRWGEAHARWAAPFVAGGQPLPLLYNGDFAQTPSGQGFDWRQPQMAGAILEYEPASGAGRTLHARFLGRRIAGSLLEHALLLAPGDYPLAFRRRFEGLRSDNGLQWILACAGGTRPQVLARSQPLAGSRGWKEEELAFTVPADCQGQWLRLGNADNPRAGQLVSGDLWLGSMRIRGSGMSRKPE